MCSLQKCGNAKTFSCLHCVWSWFVNFRVDCCVTLVEDGCLYEYGNNYFYELEEMIFGVVFKAWFHTPIGGIINFKTLALSWVDLLKWSCLALLQYLGSLLNGWEFHCISRYLAWDVYANWRVSFMPTRYLMLCLWELACLKVWWNEGLCLLPYISVNTTRFSLVFHEPFIGFDLNLWVGVNLDL